MMPMMGGPPPPMPMAAPCGLFSQEGPLPLTKLDVQVNILNAVARVTLVEVF